MRVARDSRRARQVGPQLGAGAQSPTPSSSGAGACTHRGRWPQRAPPAARGGSCAGSSPPGCHATCPCGSSAHTCRASAAAVGHAAAAKQQGAHADACLRGRRPAEAAAAALHGSCLLGAAPCAFKAAAGLGATRSPVFKPYELTAEQHPRQHACCPNRAPSGPPNVTRPFPPSPNRCSHLHAVGRPRRQQQRAGQVQDREGLPVCHVQHDAAGMGRERGWRSSLSFRLERSRRPVQSTQAGSRCSPAACYR